MRSPCSLLQIVADHLLPGPGVTLRKSSPGRGQGHNGQVRWDNRRPDPDGSLHGREPPYVEERWRSSTLSRLAEAPSLLGSLCQSNFQLPEDL